ncbi:hypothetical protein Godav_004653 [Gossypium davidsonii]|uniref:Uncharacterized protein n=1 Tax=Gossypium davidsonii TaxID=34287 RepID=A0A7J8SLW0_GOSDV|nr:hypothetical protein [Gossypium davidsonii]
MLMGSARQGENEKANKEDNIALDERDVIFGEVDGIPSIRHFKDGCPKVQRYGEEENVANSKPSPTTMRKKVEEEAYLHENNEVDPPRDGNFLCKIMKDGGRLLLHRKGSSTIPSDTSLHGSCFGLRAILGDETHAKGGMLVLFNEVVKSSTHRLESIASDGSNLMIEEEYRNKSDGDEK